MRKPSWNECASRRRTSSDARPANSGIDQDGRLREMVDGKAGTHRGILVVISSPSGAGKTTLAHRLAEQERLEFSVSYLSLIHISEPTRLLSISYAVFCLK